MSWSILRTRPLIEVDVVSNGKRASLEGVICKRDGCSEKFNEFNGWNTARGTAHIHAFFNLRCGRMWPCTGGGTTVETLEEQAHPVSAVGSLVDNAPQRTTCFGSCPSTGAGQQKPPDIARPG